MQEQAAVPITVTFSPQIINPPTKQTETEVKISKYKSEPKFKTYKE